MNEKGLLLAVGVIVDDLLGFLLALLGLIFMPIRALSALFVPDF